MVAGKQKEKEGWDSTILFNDKPAVIQLPPIVPAFEKSQNVLIAPQVGVSLGLWVDILSPNYSKFSPLTAFILLFKKGELLARHGGTHLES